MMVHIEGPIVDSVYDMALISWHKKLQPALPSHNTPAVAGGLGCFGAVHESLFGLMAKPKVTMQSSIPKRWLRGMLIYMNK